MRFKLTVGAALIAAAMGGCGSDGNNNGADAAAASQAAAAPKNVIFFLGDGMGMTTLTAARIYAVGEDGELTIDTLPETAFVKTYSNDAQVTSRKKFDATTALSQVFQRIR